MLAAERRDAIVAELRTSPAVRVTRLAEQFDVSEMTIRRDIDALEAAGALTRVHGGATRLQTLSAAEPGFSANTGRQREAKQQIALAASQLITPGMTISLTGGTTVYELAALLPDLGPLTVLTNSLPVADLLHGLAAQDRGRNLNVFLTGGERSPSEALVGPLATATVGLLNVDLCFMGVHGVDATAGMTTPNLAEAETNRAFARQSARLAVLADSTKIGVVALAQIVDLTELECLVTAGDAARPDQLAELALHTTVLTPDTLTSKETHP